MSLLARGPLRRGAQFDEIGQIGLKPAQHATTAFLASNVYAGQHPKSLHTASYDRKHYRHKQAWIGIYLDKRQILCGTTAQIVVG